MMRNPFSPIVPGHARKRTKRPVKLALFGTKEEQAALAGEAAKGKGDKSSTWWPCSESANEKLKGITAEINALQGDGAPTQSLQLLNPRHRADPVRSGQLSREEAIKILHTHFNVLSSHRCQYNQCDRLHVLLLLAFQLGAPHARRYGWLAGASDDQQRNKGCETSRAKAH